VRGSRSALYIGSDEHVQFHPRALSMHCFGTAERIR
jgi:hypothetical protein